MFLFYEPSKSTLYECNTNGQTDPDWQGRWKIVGNLAAAGQIDPETTFLNKETKDNNPLTWAYGCATNDENGTPELPFKHFQQDWWALDLKKKGYVFDGNVHMTAWNDMTWPETIIFDKFNRKGQLFKFISPFSLYEVYSSDFEVFFRVFI